MSKKAELPDLEAIAEQLWDEGFLLNEGKTEAEKLLGFDLTDEQWKEVQEELELIKEEKVGSDEDDDDFDDDFDDEDDDDLLL
jgi:hypothetical protein